MHKSTWWVLTWTRHVGGTVEDVLVLEWLLVAARGLTGLPRLLALLEAIAARDGARGPLRPFRPRALLVSEYHARGW